MEHKSKIKIADKTFMALYYFTQLPNIEESTCGIIIQQKSRLLKKPRKELQVNVMESLLTASPLGSGPE